jgi:hypothetical protein
MDKSVCNWCGVSLAGASRLTFLNGNLPICDLCLMRVRAINLAEKQKDLPPEYEKMILENWKDLI